MSGIFCPNTDLQLLILNYAVHFATRFVHYYHLQVSNANDQRQNKIASEILRVITLKLSMKLLIHTYTHTYQTADFLI
jgi:hypothetical protein